MRLGNMNGLLLAVPVLLLTCGIANAQVVGNGRIAFSDVDALGQTQIFAILPDGTGRQQLTTVSDNQFPAWTPDGTRMAFASMRTGNSEIWTMNADGSNQTQLTFNTLGGNFTPEWSRDGGRIAFASLLDSVGHPEVWVMNADGTGAQQLTFTPTSPTGPTWSLLPTWSPDGSTIAYASTITGTTQIWIIDADGSNPVQMTNGNGPAYPDSNAPQWSRDGSQIVFWSGFESQFGEVWVMNADGTNKRKLTETTDPFNSDNPEWSPDGTKIIFDSNRAGPGMIEVWMMDADGANVQLLTTGSGQTSWQPALNATSVIPATSLCGTIGLILPALVAGAVILLRRSEMQTST